MEYNILLNTALFFQNLLIILKGFEILPPGPSVCTVNICPPFVTQIRPPDTRSPSAHSSATFPHPGDRPRLCILQPPERHGEASSGGKRPSFPDDKSTNPGILTSVSRELTIVRMVMTSVSISVFEKSINQMMAAMYLPLSGNIWRARMSYQQAGLQGEAANDCGPMPALLRWHYLDFFRAALTRGYCLCKPLVNNSEQGCWRRNVKMRIQ